MCSILRWGPDISIHWITKWVAAPPTGVDHSPWCPIDLSSNSSSYTLAFTTGKLPASPSLSFHKVQIESVMFFYTSLISLHSLTYNTILFLKSSGVLSSSFDICYLVHHQDGCACFLVVCICVSLCYCLVVSFPEVTPSAKENRGSWDTRNIIQGCGTKHRYMAIAHK